MGTKAAWITVTFAAFFGGIALGKRLGDLHDAPTMRVYDRELAGEAQAAKWRSMGLRSKLQARKQGGA